MDDYQKLASQFIAGAPGQGQFGLQTFAPIREAQTGKRSALQGLAIARLRNALGHQKMMSKVENQIMDLNGQAQQAGVADYLGAALGGANVISGLNQSDQIYKQLGLKRQSGLDLLLGGI